MKTYNIYINGQWTSSTSKLTFPTINPAKKTQILATFPQGTREDVARAVIAAEKALPAWKKMPAPRRGELLLEIASLLKKRKQKLGELVTLEMGKVLKEG